MAELVDARDSKSRDFGHESSILSLGTLCAMEPIIVGGTYRHYKNKDYRVIATGWIEATMEPAVIYKALYDIPELGSEAVFVRPLSNFTEMVTVDDVTIPRFKHIG